MLRSGFTYPIGYDDKSRYSRNLIQLTFNAIVGGWKVSQRKTAQAKERNQDEQLSQRSSLTFISLVYRPLRQPLFKERRLRILERSNKLK
jgi:hypothetical protein